MGIVLVILLSIIAGIAKSICDTLFFRYEYSVFKDAKFIWDVWGPVDGKAGTWKNKWKLDDNGNVIRDSNGQPKYERFYLSSTLLVWLTDPWHAFDNIRILSMFSIPLLVILFGLKWWIVLLCVVAFYLTFHIIFDFHLLSKQQ